MELDVHREASVAEPFDQVRLPQRPVPVQKPAVQPRRQLQQFAYPTRRGQRRPAQVVVEVDVVVDGPREVGDATEHRAGMLAERLLETGLLRHGLMDIVQELRARDAVRRFEQLQPADVHRMLPRLDEQEHRIGRRDQLHRGSLRVADHLCMPTPGL